MLELSEFAMCSGQGMLYHWEQLGLPIHRDYMTPLDREEFDALGACGRPVGCSRLTPAQWRRLHEYWTEGHSVIALARFSGVHRNTITDYWLRRGWPTNRGYLPPLDRAAFEALGRNEDG